MASDFPVPRKRPVPIVPPIAIICTWRAERDRASLSARMGGPSLGRSDGGIPYSVSLSSGLITWMGDFEWKREWEWEWDWGWG